MLTVYIFEFYIFNILPINIKFLISFSFAQSFCMYYQYPFMIKDCIFYVLHNTKKQTIENKHTKSQSSCQSHSHHINTKGPKNKKNAIRVVKELVNLYSSGYCLSLFILKIIIKVRYTRKLDLLLLFMVFDGEKYCCAYD